MKSILMIDLLRFIWLCVRKHSRLSNDKQIATPPLQTTAVYTTSVAGSLPHRSDIDGLRAFAIIPVLLFHSGFQIFSGGYVGVDVFFTISGFLITSILLRDIDNKQFSYIDFFKRRIRRLMPMAILMYLFVLLTFMFIYPVEYFKGVTAATFSSLLFLSNIYFWKTGGGYFGENLEINPLLHTWSLSVEEQFYLVFPLLLVILFWITRNAVHKFLFILAGILVSLCVAVMYTPSMESFAAFYLLPPRMYELAIGSLAAVFVYYWPDNKLREYRYLQEVGIFMIILPVFIFDSQTLFPSYNALLPCIGTVLVILSVGKNGWASFLLNSRTAVYIGVVSYSLYLWHWPLIVMKNWLVGHESNFLIDFSVLALALVFSSITYRFIETPFRNKKAVSDKNLMALAGISFVSLGTLSATLYQQGNSIIVDPNGTIDTVYQQSVTPASNREACFEKVRLTGRFHSCELSANIEKPDGQNIFVWGDSHGSAFIPALESLSTKHNVFFSNNSGCPPVINLKRVDYSQSCPRISQQIFDHIIKQQYDLVILVGAFSNYLNWGMVGELDAKQGKDIESSTAAFARHMPETLKRFEQANLPFLVIVQPPRMNNSVPQSFLRTETLGKKYAGDTISMAAYEEQIAPLFKIIPQKWHSNLIDLRRVYCPQGICISIRDEKLLYKDSHHISNDYASYLSQYFQPIIESTLWGAPALADSSAEDEVTPEMITTDANAASATFIQPGIQG